MKILITGANGQLGCEIRKIISTGRSEIGEVSENIKRSNVLALDVLGLDITNAGMVKEILMKEKPDVVINCAAATNVDGCEDDKETAFKINAIGARNLAIASELVGAKIVQVSTDYVFDGEGSVPLSEYDTTMPYSVYGKSKLAGENYVRDFCKKYFIVRTSWLYGSTGKNFVYTMLNLGEKNSEIKVVNDQSGNPTNANDLAYHILKLIETDEYGVYHCSGNGECTWYDFAKLIMEISNKSCIVKPCTSEEYVTRARRPKYSSLDNLMLRSTIGDNMRYWKDALKSFLSSI